MAKCRHADGFCQYDCEEAAGRRATLAALRRLRARINGAHARASEHNNGPYVKGYCCGLNDARIYIDREIERAKGGGRGK